MMKREFCTGLLAGAAVLMMAGVGQATQWVADFTNWAGQDATAVSTYTDTDGGNPNSYTVTFNGAAGLPAGWLTQGNRGGAPTTAKFTNAAGGGNGRARFSTALPASMDANGGISIGWNVRYGSYAMTRAPVQIAVTDSGATQTAGGVEYNCYIRVQNGTALRILSNGGGTYGQIDELPVNVADGQYHQWSCAVITADGVAHWKMWLDGTLLLFTGIDGAHQFDPGTGLEDFSFRTTPNDFTGDPYIGLGELNSQDIWDFEFDCVSYKDDGLEPLTCGGAVTCDSVVAPPGPQTSTALRNGAATPPSFNFTFTNTGSGNASYSVAETDASGTPLDYAWLTLDKTGAALVPPVGTDAVVATVDTNLTAGIHTAYITFTDGCNPATKHTRQIDLTITDCGFAVWPGREVARSFIPGSPGVLADATFTVTNTGTDGLTYTIQKEGADSAWLTLNSNGGGPLANGQTATATVSFNPVGVSSGLHTCTLRFASTKAGCTNSPPDVVCTVALNILDATSATEQLNAEFTTFNGTDIVATSPVVSCDPSVVLTREFSVQPSPLQVDQLATGWLRQGSIDGISTTAKFDNPQGPAGDLTGVGRARFRSFLPFGNTFDPAKGMAVAWRMRIGDYSPTRAPIQITFPRVAGPFGTAETLSIPGQVFNCYVRVQNGRNVSILRNGGTLWAGIGTLVLPASIAGATDSDYHQWTAAVCYGGDDLAYWNLWLDGEKLMFAGSDPNGSAGSPTGPGGATFSFRTPLEDVTPDPYIGLGEQQLSIDIWDFDFDWIRLLSYNVSGCPFWDGEGCVPVPACPVPFADADEDGDVDMNDFATLQRCITIGAGSSLESLPAECWCFDRNTNKVIGDAVDLNRFLACGTGPDVQWQPGPGCE